MVAVDLAQIVPLLPGRAGLPGVTLRDLVGVGIGTVAIDQTLIIPTFRGRAGLPGITVAELLAVLNGEDTAYSDLLDTLAAPTHRWRLSDTLLAGEAADSGSVPVAGALVGDVTPGAAALVTGTPRSFDFDGVTGRVTLPTPQLSTAATGTLIAWITTRSAPAANATIIGLSGLGGAQFFRFEVASTLGIRMSISPSGGSTQQMVRTVTTPLLTLNTRHMVAMTSDAVNPNATYIDGVVVPEVDIATTLAGAATNHDWFARVGTVETAALGALPRATPSNFWDGLAAELTIIDTTVLTAAQIAQLFVAGTAAAW